MYFSPSQNYEGPIKQLVKQVQTWEFAKKREHINPNFDISKEQSNSVSWQHYLSNLDKDYRAELMTELGGSYDVRDEKLRELTLVNCNFFQGIPSFFKEFKDLEKITFEGCVIFDFKNFANLCSVTKFFDDMPFEESFLKILQQTDPTWITTKIERLAKNWKGKKKDWMETDLKPIIDGLKPIDELQEELPYLVEEFMSDFLKEFFPEHTKIGLKGLDHVETVEIDESNFLDVW